MIAGGTLTYHLVTSTFGTATVLANISNVFHANTWNGASWSGWVNIGVSALGQKILDATSWGQGRIDFVYRNISSYSYANPGDSVRTYEYGATLSHAWFNGSWQTEGLPTGLALGAKLTTWGPGRLDVFYDLVNCTNYCAHSGGGHLYLN
jgi:hypothetical protein